MKGLTRAALPVVMIAAVTFAVSMALASAGNGAVKAPSNAVATSEHVTVPTVPSASVVASAVTCEVDWCAVTIGPNGREILFYVDGPDRIGWLLQTPVTIDVPQRNAS